MGESFTAGQLLGMLTVMLFIEKNNGIPKDFLDQAKTVLARKSSEYMQIPEEDLYLILEKKVEEIEKL